jgi:GNAT superfamily N-acetyltransferase
MESVRPWVEASLGVSLEAMDDPAPVVASQACSADSPLWAIRTAGRAVVTVGAGSADALRPVVGGLALDELFSVFGAYELSRVTLPHGFGVWGPTLYNAADASCLRPVDDERPVQLGPAKLATSVDFDVFWHCPRGRDDIGFGIYEEDRLVALTTAWPEFDRLWDVGLDVVPDARGRGLGAAVLSAAGRWILQQGAVMMASVAPWNVPSARLQRAIGMQHIFTDMRGIPGPMLAPPQPLGTPLPGAKLVNYLPDWAANKEIESRPE